MIKKINQDLIHQLLQQAADSPRLRSNVNFHTVLDDPVQRLLIGIKKGSYVRPHHHPDPKKWELMVVIKGMLCLSIFDKNGVIVEHIPLSTGESAHGAELPPGTWHTIYPISDNAVFLEVKAGPYMPAEPTDFAAWAPQEGEPEATRFLAWVEHAAVGEKFLSEPLPPFSTTSD